MSFDRSQFDGWSHQQMVDAYVGAHLDREANSALRTSFMDGTYAGIPVRQWIEILTAIKVDIAKAKIICGNCGDNHEPLYRKCGPNCPLDALVNIREAMENVA